MTKSSSVGPSRLLRRREAEGTHRREPANCSYVYDTGISGARLISLLNEREELLAAYGWHPRRRR
jgi:hypothetical protein